MTPEPAEQIERQIKDLEDEERELSRRLEGLRGRVSGLRQALGILLATMGADDKVGDLSPAVERPMHVRHRTLPDPATNARWAYMLRLINAAPPSGITIEDLVRETEKEGHSLPSGVARSLVSIAAKEGVIRRVGTGRYRGMNAHAVNEVSSKEETGAPTPRNLNPNPEMSFSGDYEDVAKAGGT